MNRVDDLAHLLIVGVLALDLILEVLLKLLIFQLDVFELLLKPSHDLLLSQKFFGHLSQGALLILFDLLHARIDGVLSLIELLVLVFQVDEATTETFNASTVVIVNVLIVSDDLLEEVCVLTKIAKFALPILEL